MGIMLSSLLFISTHCDAKMFFYRIPFRITTYTPIKTEEIKRLALKGGMQEISSRNYDQVIKTLHSNSNKCHMFDSDNIRIYISDENHEYFIDNKGWVLFKNKKISTCSKNKIDEDAIVKLLNDGNIDVWKSEE